MAGKRRADSDLNQDNWDNDDDEVVEVGSFQVADDTVLAKRKIKTARRRIKASNKDNKPSPFGSFQGFSSSSSSGTDKKPTFGLGFKASSSKPTFGSGFSLSSSKPTVPTAPLSFGAKLSNPSADEMDAKPTIMKTALNGGGNTSNSNSNTDYSTKLKALNLAVSSWIQQHVAKTPVCDLTPIFNDYKKHLAQIEEKYGSQTNSSGIIFGGNEAKSAVTKEVNTEVKSGISQAFPGFSAAPTQSDTKVEKKETSIGGSKLTFGSSVPGFGSTSGMGFSFTGVAAAKKEEERPSEGKVDEDQSPKEEIKSVEEKDAVFSIRSKIYYKKDNQYKERGIGMLHLKKTGSTGQIIIRADTSLGNIIFNIGVPEGLPVQRQGKNNVLLMSPMNPPTDKVCPKCNKKYPNPQTSNVCESSCTPDATAVLLRVKTAEDADKLLEEINKLKE